jgi:hypothetical protein
MPKHQLKKMIVEYDRIIMLGHGTERGLIGFGDFHRFKLRIFVKR